MGMSASHGGSGRRSRAVPQMNVTPLVDVVLVLLIIFMVVTPLLSKQLWLQLPKDADDAPPPTENKSVVLSVKADGTLEINGAPVPKADLEAKIARVMAARAEKAVFFDAADDAPYALTVEAMDMAKRGGAKTVAILTTRVAP